MSTPYTLRLGGQVFTTKKAARHVIQDILHSAPLNRPLPFNADALLRDLVVRNPEKAERIGPGIRHFEVRENYQPRWKTSRGFWFIRKDGVAVDFSYVRCLDGSAKSHYEKFVQACRSAIQNQTDACKRRFFAEALKPTCPLLGIPLTPENAHVDHEPTATFANIVAAWMRLHEYTEERLPAIRTTIDGNMERYEFADPVIRDMFVCFHDGNAKLRVISAEANNSRVKEFAREERENR